MQKSPRLKAAEILGLRELLEKNGADGETRTLTACATGT